MEFRQHNFLDTLACFGTTSTQLSCEFISSARSIAKGITQDARDVANRCQARKACLIALCRGKKTFNKSSRFLTSGKAVFDYRTACCWESVNTDLSSWTVALFACISDASNDHWANNNEIKIAEECAESPCMAGLRALVPAG